MKRLNGLFIALTIMRPLLLPPTPRLEKQPMIEPASLVMAQRRP